MAAVHGKGGSVTWGVAGVVDSEVTNWSLEATSDVAEASSMASSNDWKEFLAGLRGWTATVETIRTSALTIADAIGVSSSLSLLDTLNTYSGSAICTSIVATADMGDVVKQTFQFQGTGALASA